MSGSSASDGSGPQPGDRLLIVCDGGRSISRLVHYPPPLEIEERGGAYVLNDDGDADEWVYVWIPEPG